MTGKGERGGNEGGGGCCSDPFLVPLLVFLFLLVCRPFLVEEATETFPVECGLRFIRFGGDEEG